MASSTSTSTSTTTTNPQTYKFKYSGEVAPTSAAPLLVSFPAGPPKNSVLHNPTKRAKHSHDDDADNDDEALAISCYGPKSEKVPRRATQRLVVMETDAMLYHGSSIVSPARKITGGPNVARYVLGVVDKRSNTIELHESPQQIIPMQQEVKAIERQVDDHTHHGDYYETRHLLVEAFGGARSLKRLRSEIANRVSDDNTAVGIKTDDALRDTAEMAIAAATEGAKETTEFTLPPYNKDATVPSGIYEIGKIIAPDCWGALREASQALIAASRKEKLTTPVTEAYPSSVLEALNLLASASSTKEKKQLASIMQFAAFVIKFYKEFRRSWNKGEEALATRLGVPIVVLNHLLSLFAEKTTVDDKTSYAPSKLLQAKCINYILVLLLTINNFRLPLTQVIIDLDLKETTAMVHCKAVGCKISVKRTKASKDAAPSSEPQASAITATLNAPLVLPELTLRRGKKARS